MDAKDMETLADLIVARLAERLDDFSYAVAQKVVELSGEFNQEELVEMAKKVQQTLTPDVTITTLDE
jgi:hypothetical protein